MLQSRIQLTSLHKVKTHSNITGNKIVDTLAKNGRHKQHSLPTEPHGFAHSTPYYFQKDEWIGIHYTPYKGPIRNLQRYLIKYTTEHHLTELARHFPNINKWTSDDVNIDKISSNTFWTNPHISEKKKNNLLSFVPINIWEVLENTFSGPYVTLTLPAHSVQQTLLIHGHMSFSLVLNPTCMPYASNVITKPSGNYENPSYPHHFPVVRH